MPNSSRETKLSGTNADREIFVIPVQLTTCRTGYLPRLIHTLAICVIIHTYMVTVYKKNTVLFTVNVELADLLFRSRYAPKIMLHRYYAGCFDVKS